MNANRFDVLWKSFFVRFEQSENAGFFDKRGRNLEREGKLLDPSAKDNTW